MMKKIFAFLLCVLAVAGCSKHDPVLSGVRKDIFESNEVVAINKDVPALSQSIKNIYGDEKCEYSQDSSNVIFYGDKKIWSGFSTTSVVKTDQKPICTGGAIYTGLSTGEVIKINTATNKLVWMADVFRLNNLTGGASVVDIVARVGLNGQYVYAGGLGDAFCKINAGSGDKIWCLNISVPVDFIMVDDFIFVVGTDNKLYAVNKTNGKVYWKTEIKKQVKPTYDGQFVIVGKEHINYKTGNIEK